MNGLFINLGNDNVYFSTVRSMARFGLLMLNGGNWGGNNQIMTDTSFLMLPSTHPKHKPCLRLFMVAKR